MIPIYTGFDKREAFGWHTFAASVMDRTTEAVSFSPVSGPQRDGSNAFTRARFLVPFLRKYKGFAIFADACDMICMADISDLWKLQDPAFAVQVVKHDYRTKYSRKYIGTEMESDNTDYPRKNWASLMLMNCAHPAWRTLTRIFEMDSMDLLQFRFMDDDEIGGLPREWNWLCDEYGENDAAKVCHWTTGIPGFPNYTDSPMADLWASEALKVTHVTP